MGVIVSRTCTEIPDGDGDRHHREERQSRPLKEYRDTPAYVLVGDPGAGKTTAFEMECEALGEEAHCLITADNFLSYDVSTLPSEWREKTLFIDGLDEVRAGAQGASEFREIRKLLRALGKPRFRLSCREADWLGENDRQHLESVSPDSQVKVLRLDPLTDADIASILEGRRDLDDARAFIDAARERGVDGLLANPQTLKMLADVARKDEWPNSRKETFEMACGKMVREHNKEHQAARESGSPPAPDQLLDAAGRLCALQLISGGAGYTLRGEPDEEYPAPDQCDYDRQTLRFALSTNLFKGVSNNCFSPVHRHIAEFLGARHLAGVIEDGLPARRVIALMVGEDGGVVTEMRGLSAWLAAHSRDARANLIERDPIGVGLYGDIGEFSLDEKRALLESLNREGERLGPLWQSATAFGALAAPDMEPVLREVLEDEDRGPDHQMFTDFVLSAMQEGAPLPGFGELLLQMVRDGTRWPQVNKSALHAFIHNCTDLGARVGKLKPLLTDIRGGRVADPDNELLGTLLFELYPRNLSPPEVWDCFYGTRNRDSFFGMYYGFYMLGLPEKSSDDQVAELLDSLKERFSGLRPTAGSSTRLENLPVKLLARGLQSHGDQLSTGHLYDWLDLGFTEVLGHPIGDQKDIEQIGSWLQQRPEILKALVLEGLLRCPESDEFRLHAISVWRRGYGASTPADFGLWCLEQAVSKADDRPLAAEHLLEMAVRAHRDHSGNAGLSLEVLQERTREKAGLRESLDQLLAPSPLLERELEDEQKWRNEQKEKQLRWLDHVRSNKTALLENRAAPALLHHIAKLNLEGPQALEESLAGERDLIDAALQGLQNSIHREDVPTLEEILRLREQNRMHYLGEPYLAGIEVAAGTADVCQWDDDLICRAIAFHCNWPLLNRNCKWYERLLGDRPEMVAQVLVKSGVSGFRSGREQIDKLSELAHDKGHAQVARHASLPLLRAFPTRCRSKQLNALDDLLKAAIQHADRTALQELIDTKLSRKSMDDAQRVYWLAGGVIVSPEVYEYLLRVFSAGREGRIRHLTTFFSSLPGPVTSLADKLESPALGLLVRLVGSTVGPDEQWKEGWGVTPAMEASRLVGDLIQRLAASPAKEASNALDELLTDPELSSWHDELSQAQDTQRVIRRDAGYRHPEIAQVCRTLNGGTPANPADLAALLMDWLQKLAVQIRTGNTDDWRQYWNVDSHGRPVDPRPEESCRNALLSALRERLPDGVRAEREGQHANDKRDDIWVSRHGFQVPVEVKKNTNRNLWSAPRNQLIAQYTSTPGSDGYGIYLVFWFGKEHTQPPPSGDRPGNPDELRERLEATLTPAEARKISVCVVDVSRPDK